MLSNYVQASNDTDILTRALPLAEVRPSKTFVCLATDLTGCYAERIDLVANE